MTNIIAIDPGTEQSAWVQMDGGRILALAIEPNAEVAARMLRREHANAAVVAIERVESYGMPVGREVFDTVRWAGRFEQAAQPCRVLLVPRRDVKLHLCGSPRANDASIRQALIDRFGGKERAIGRKASPGPLHGVRADMWAALAVAVTAHDQLEGIA